MLDYYKALGADNNVWVAEEFNLLEGYLDRNRKPTSLLLFGT